MYTYPFSQGLALYEGKRGFGFEVRLKNEETIKNIHMQERMHIIKHLSDPMYGCLNWATIIYFHPWKRVNLLDATLSFE